MLFGLETWLSSKFPAVRYHCKIWQPHGSSQNLVHLTNAVNRSAKQCSDVLQIEIYQSLAIISDFSPCLGKQNNDDENCETFFGYNIAKSNLELKQKNMIPPRTIGVDKWAVANNFFVDVRRSPKQWNGKTFFRTNNDVCAVTT